MNIPSVPEFPSIEDATPLASKRPCGYNCVAHNLYSIIELLPRVVGALAPFESERLLADNEQIEVLREIRDLLRVMAEPVLAQRDERLRISLTAIVGRSKQKGKAVLLMDGSRSQLAIREATGMDSGNLSRLAKELRSKELIGADDRPKLVISIPPNFFENSEKQNG